MMVLEWESAELLAHGGITLLRATALLLAALALSLAFRHWSPGVRNGVWMATLAGLLALPVLPVLVPQFSVPAPAFGGGSPQADEPPAFDVRALPGDGSGEPTTAGEGELDMNPDVGMGEGYGGPEGGPSGLIEVDPSEAERDRGAQSEDGAHGGVPWGGGPGSPGASGPSGVPGASGLTAAPAMSESYGWDRARTAIEGLLLLWLAGALLILVGLGVGLHRSRRLLRTAVPVTDPGWREPLRAAQRAVGVQGKVFLGVVAGLESPLAGGLIRPAILLPEGTREWSRDRREVVLAHELVHLKRRDQIWQILGRVILALYWFHPLVWLAVREATLAREEACDETVLSLGHRPSSYARHLMALAADQPFPAPALSRVHRPPLERRIRTLLGPVRRSHRGMRPAVMGLIALWGLTTAALHPASGPTNPATADAEMDGAPTAETTVPSELAALPELPTDPSPMGAPRSEPASASASDGDAGSQPGSGVLDGSAPTSRSDLDPGQACLPREEGPGFEEPGEDGAVRLIHRAIGDLRVCYESSESLELQQLGLEEEGLPDGSWVVLAVRGPELVQRMEITGDPDGVHHAWFVNGQERPFDDQAREWRDAMLDVATGERRLRVARGRVLGLRRDIEPDVRPMIREIRRTGELGELARRISALQMAARFTEDEETRARLEEEIGQLRERLEEERGEVEGVREELRERRGEMEERAREIRIRIRDLGLDEELRDAGRELRVPFLRLREIVEEIAREPEG